MKNSIDIRKINHSILTSPAAFIEVSEKEYRHSIDKTVEKALINQKRILLLSGPSAAGKTTTANLIKDKILSKGKMCIVLSLDDFYRDAKDPLYPKDNKGERDYENPQALNIPNIEKTLYNIATDKEFYLPKYDFKIGGNVGYNRHSPIGKGCVIVEGLHAINPIISKSVPDGGEMKIFINVKTSITHKGKRVLSARKIRFMRRLVRDSIFRGSDLMRTLGMWSNVERGEEKYLYPNECMADVTINTLHPYEIALMKDRVKDMMKKSDKSNMPYLKSLLHALHLSVSLDEHLVPKDSLIREFVGGGIYESIY